MRSFAYGRHPVDRSPETTRQALNPVYQPPYVESFRLDVPERIRVPMHVPAHVLQATPSIKDQQSDYKVPTVDGSAPPDWESAHLEVPVVRIVPLPAKPVLLDPSAQGKEDPDLGSGSEAEEREA